MEIIGQLFRALLLIVIAILITSSGAWLINETIFGFLSYSFFINFALSLVGILLVAFGVYLFYLVIKALNGKL